jgi:hypothetical protein
LGFSETPLCSLWIHLLGFGEIQNLPGTWKGIELVGRINSNGENPYYTDSMKGRFTIYRDNKNTFSLK